MVVTLMGARMCQVHWILRPRRRTLQGNNRHLRNCKRRSLVCCCVVQVVTHDQGCSVPQFRIGTNIPTNWPLVKSPNSWRQLPRVLCLKPKEKLCVKLGWMVIHRMVICKQNWQHS